MDFDRLLVKLEGLEKASKSGRKVKHLYNVITRKDIWYLAYANIYNNQGAITKGIDDTTLDGLSSERIETLINSIKADSYRPKPVRRAYIPKRDGKPRPLGVPSGNDKLFQAVIKILLEQVYEPIFHETSHGFRTAYSCHTALEQIKSGWTGMKWFIEFDIKGFFDHVNHDILINLLEKKIDDRKFIKIIKRFLKAGYLEDWKFHPTYSGTPQGGIISSILSNIYLHELDEYMAKATCNFHQGQRRPVNPEYKRIGQKIYRLRKKLVDNPTLIKELKVLQRIQKGITSGIENTPDFKRLRYCRYADDFVCGVIGSYNDAKRVLESVREFLSSHLHLQLSPKKTHAIQAKKGIEFLSYGIRTQHGDRMRKMKFHGTHSTMRTINGKIVLEVPKRKVIDFCNKHGYGDWQRKKSLHRPHLAIYSELEIVQAYNAELRGLANYYSLARDCKKSLHSLAYLELQSLFKTIAFKRKCSLSKVIPNLKQADRYALRYKIEGQWREIIIFQLKHMENKPIVVDELPRTANYFRLGTELIRRLEASECEYCGTTDTPMEVHHVRKLKDLQSKPYLEQWEKRMIARNRKTMILCVSCHHLLHQGKLPDNR